MKKFAILIDSTGDLPREMRERYLIDYVAMGYVVDGVEYKASLDWRSHTPREFYNFMRDGKRITTVQVHVDTYTERFSEYLSAGRDVVYIACSSALSGSYNTSRVVAESLKETYPDNTVYCVDSLISSLGQGSLAIAAASMRDEGKSAAETAEWLVANRLKVNQFGTVESLEYLRAAGRVTATSAFFGNLFGVKPIVISDALGQNFAVKKVKGALTAKKDMAQSISEIVENPEQQTLYISHADDVAAAEQFRDEILAANNFKDVYMSYIGPIVGASVGPGTIISFCVGSEVTVEGHA